MNNDLKLAENLKLFRQKFNLTQNDVAEIINKDRSSIAKYESGAAQPPFSVLNLFSKLYNVSIDELCGISAEEYLVAQNKEDDNLNIENIVSGLDKQEQLLLLKIKMMSKEKKREFFKLLEEFSKS